MKSPQFYEPFLDYEYILIYHTDAFVFYDALEYFCSLGYDYIGAPWSAWFPWFRKIARDKLEPAGISRVGNGGFCLRKVKAFYDLLTNNRDLVQRHGGNEDQFFSVCGKRAELGFNVAPYDIAFKFAAEVNPSRVIKKNGGHFPFGAHKWFGYNADLFIDYFLKLGYDLRPLKGKLCNLNFANDIRQGLCEVATYRLIRLAKHGQDLLKYLPTNHFASVRILRSPDAMKIFESIKEIAIADEIFFYDDLEALINALKAEEPRQDTIKEPYMRAWVNDLTVEEPLHLVISVADEAPLLAVLDKAGLRYGKHVISFQQEYLKYCEKLFHNLGK